MLPGVIGYPRLAEYCPKNKGQHIRIVQPGPDRRRFCEYEAKGQFGTGPAQHHRDQTVFK